MRALIASLIVVSPLLVLAQPAKTHFDHRREAQAAYQRKDYAAALAATRAALKMRPDSPRYLYNVAALSCLTGDKPAALNTLQQLAMLGVVMPVDRDPDFAGLQGTVEFRNVLQLFATNAEPRGEAEVLAELPGRTGLIEGIAFRARTGDLFLGDVHHRCIWRRDRTGQVTRFSAEDEELFGIFGLAVDEPRNTLWAATTALPEMAGFEEDTKGFAALAEFNLATSELRRIIPVPVDGREHGLGDLIVAPDGTVYATDSKAPVIWQLVPGNEALEKVVESPLFGSLQGMVLQQRTLLVADYSNGLIAVDLPTGNMTALAPPENTTLLGIDGMVPVSGGVVATQNGVNPQRVVHIALKPEFDAVTTVTVLASGQPNLTDLTLLTLMGDRPTFIAGGGWDGFDGTKAKQPRPHTVRIFQTNVP